MTLLTNVALIVCADTRAEELARQLLVSFEVYGIKGDDSFYIWSNGFWRSLDRRAVPDVVDVLIYHQKDSGLVPRSTSATVELEFTAPGARIVEREGAFPIVYPFFPGACPVGTKDVHEILDFISARKSGSNGARLPSICRPPQVQSFLGALAILCQGYLVIAAINSMKNGESIGDIMASALHRMGWEPGLIKLSTAELRVRIIRVRATSWWGLLGWRYDSIRSVKREWGGTADYEGWEPLESLLLHVLPDEEAQSGGKLESLVPGTSTGADLDELVASAYVSLANRLDHDRR